VGQAEEAAPGSVATATGTSEPLVTTSGEQEPTLQDPPDGASLSALIEAMGGQLQEGQAPVYPQGYVDLCWDPVMGMYYVYVSDAGSLNPAAARRALAGAPLTVVGVGHTRDEFAMWERQARDVLLDVSAQFAANTTIVMPDRQRGDALCSPTGPYLLIEIYEDEPGLDFAALLAGIPPDLVVIKVGGAEPQLLSEFDHPTG
jgi:hypothetical protein